MRVYFFAGLLGILSCLAPSCTDAASPNAATEVPPAPIESSNVPDPDVITNSSSEMDFARKRYARIERMAEEGRLNCETVEYRCTDDTGGGAFYFCRLDGELVRATHEFNRYSHGGGSEVYYYDGDELFFALLTSSSWSFGGPTQVNDDGEETNGTVDRILEERRYYYAGNLIERLYKDYTVKSWERATPPENIANARRGTSVDNGIGSPAVLAVAKTRTHGCD